MPQAVDLDLHEINILTRYHRENNEPSTAGAFWKVDFCRLSGPHECH